MEGTPFAVENNEDDKEEERKAKLKKPEHLGILAIEPASEKEPELSPLEKALAAIRRPEEEAEEKPPATAEEEPVVLPEAEPPAERVPKEDARRIVHEMVEVEQQPEAEEEKAPEPETEEEPKPVVEVEPAKTPEVESPEPEAEPAPVAEVEPEVVKPEAAQEEPVVQVMPEKAPEPETEPEPEPEPKTPIETPVEKPETPPDEDKKKPGFIRSLFRRRERDKAEEEPKKVEEPAEQEPEEPVPIIEKDEPEGPEFHFTEKTEKAPEEPEAPPEPEAKPEHIGKMLLNVEDVAVERPPEPVVEAEASSQAAEEKMKVEASPIEPMSGKRIETLSRAELMELGATIEINGNNLRHIYETHLIGEHGLRRLIAEHIRGGNLEKALRREVLAHEMDFERDPVMRNMTPQTSTPVEDNHTVLEKLLQEADVSMSSQGDQTGFAEASTKYQAAGSRQRQSRQYRVLDIALVATISTLTLLVILVLLMR